MVPVISVQLLGMSSEAMVIMVIKIPEQQHQQNLGAWEKSPMLDP